jgi:indole-3-glycerol phosphate synthase
MEKFTPAVLERIIAARSLPPPFMKAVARDGEDVKAIAEVKRSSPSAGAIRKSVCAGEIVCAYRDAGASAVSVLTCAHRFEGDLTDLAKGAAAAPSIPLLRKDFITEPYQVLEARAFGASAVLLIAAALSPARLREVVSYASSLGLDALVEAHDASDLATALEAGSKLIGINNRDLSTLEVDITATEKLLPLIPAGFVVVSESGIKTREHVEYMQALGVDAILIGEALMRAEDPGAKLGELLGRQVVKVESSVKEVDESCGSKSAG